MGHQSVVLGKAMVTFGGKTQTDLNSLVHVWDSGFHFSWVMIKLMLMSADAESGEWTHLDPPHFKGNGDWAHHPPTTRFVTFYFLHVHLMVLHFRVGGTAVQWGASVFIFGGFGPTADAKEALNDCYECTLGHTAEELTVNPLSASLASSTINANHLLLSLPSEAMIHILLQLDVTSLGRLQCTCKELYVLGCVIMMMVDDDDGVNVKVVYFSEDDLLWKPLVKKNCTTHFQMHDAESAFAWYHIHDR